MARTPDQVGAVIDNALTDPTAFPNISQSAVAEWRLWRNIVATTISFFESILDLFTSQMTTALDTKQYGGIQWWATKMLAYQSGYSLQVDSQGNVSYPTIDTTAQIIQKASVREVTVNGDLILFIKVAAVDDNGNYIPLTPEQQLQVQDYITSIKPAGVKTNLVSLPADTIYYNVTVLYDPLYNSFDVQTNITNALAAYRQNIGFDGIFYPSSYLDSIVNAQGVKGVLINSLQGAANGQPLGGLGISYELASGYFNFSTDANGNNNNLLTLTPAT